MLPHPVILVGAGTVLPPLVNADAVVSHIGEGNFVWVPVGRVPGGLSIQDAGAVKVAKYTPWYLPDFCRDGINRGDERGVINIGMKRIPVHAPHS